MIYLAKGSIWLSALAGAAYPQPCRATVDFCPEQVVTSSLVFASDIFAADLDGDGDLDILSASVGDNQIAWYENVDGNGNFGRPNVITTSAIWARSVFAVDLDQDGDIDVLSASSGDGGKIAWYENIHGSFGRERVISTNATAAFSVFAADLDGDGHIDVISASQGDDKIAWYKNLDGFATFGPQQIISMSAMRASSVFAVDLDGDGDKDILSASQDDNKIACYENLDGLGNFGPQKSISTSVSGAFAVTADDLDGDGDMDVLAAGLDDTVAWFKNIDGNGTFGPPRGLTHLVDRPFSLCTADLDGDGDIDILVASNTDNKISWYENLDGKGQFGPQQIISSKIRVATGVVAADVNQDGQVDVISASWESGKISLHKNGCSPTSSPSLHPTVPVTLSPSFPETLLPTMPPVVPTPPPPTTTPTDPAFSTPRPTNDPTPLSTAPSTTEMPTPLHVPALAAASNEGLSTATKAGIGTSMSVLLVAVIILSGILWTRHSRQAPQTYPPSTAPGNRGTGVKTAQGYHDAAPPMHSVVLDHGDEGPVDDGLSTL